MRSNKLSFVIAMGVLFATVGASTVAADQSSQTRAQTKEELEKAHKAGTHGGNTEVEKAAK